MSLDTSCVVDGLVNRTMSNNYRETDVILSCATDPVNSFASLCIVFVLLPVNMG